MVFDTVLFRTTLIPALIVVVGCWSWFPGLLTSAGRPAAMPAPNPYQAGRPPGASAVSANTACRGTASTIPA